MSRAPLQVLVLPFRRKDEHDLEFALFKRKQSTGGYWQGIAGGGEASETPIEAARREAFEEAGISLDARFLTLDCLTMIPVVGVCGFIWGEEHLVIPEYCFGVESAHIERLSDEHSEYCWLDYPSAVKLVKWDSNRSALWELNHRLSHSLAEA